MNDRLLKVMAGGLLNVNMMVRVFKGKCKWAANVNGLLEVNHIQVFLITRQQIVASYQSNKLVASSK